MLKYKFIYYKFLLILKEIYLDLKVLIVIIQNNENWLLLVFFANK